MRRSISRFLAVSSDLAGCRASLTAAFSSGSAAQGIRFSNPFIKPRDPELYSDSIVLEAALRTDTSDAATKEDAERGFLPGVIKGLPFDRAGVPSTSAAGHEQPVLLDYLDINRLHLKLGTRGIKSRAMRVRVRGWESEGQTVSPRVLVDLVHVSSLTGKMEKVEMKFAPRGARLVVDVPVVIVGDEHSPGVKAGGYLDEIFKFARLTVPGDRIPPYVLADISGVSIGGSVRFKDLKLPEGCELDPETYGETRKTSIRHAVVKIQRPKA